MQIIAVCESLDSLGHFDWTPNLPAGTRSKALANMVLTSRTQAVAFRPAATRCNVRNHSLHCRAEESKVSREYNEAEGKVSAPETGGPGGKGTKNADGTYYVDELPVSSPAFFWRAL